jgi:hypothetical protein
MINLPDPAAVAKQGHSRMMLVIWYIRLTIEQAALVGQSSRLRESSMHEREPHAHNINGYMRSLTIIFQDANHHNDIACSSWALGLRAQSQV